MITDVTLLKIMSERSIYEKYISFIGRSALEVEIRTVLDGFGAYFDEYAHDKINFEEFITWFSYHFKPDLPESKQLIYKEILNRAYQSQAEVAEKVIQKFQELETAELIRLHLDEKFDLDDIRGILELHERQLGSIEFKDDESLIENDIDKILETFDSEDGLKWRLNCLNETIGPLSKGKFIIVAAYVDVGKTMFCVSEAAYMAKQLTEGTILWLNNEEDDYRVYRKIWKSVLGCNDETLMLHKDKAADDYKKRMHGDINRIKFINVRNKGIKEIQNLFKLYNPKLAVIDQVDKVPNVGYKSFSDHDRLKNLYGEVRALANEYCPIMAVSQADATTVRYDKDSGDVDYQLYPHHRQLDGSKVGKPGEADAIIMIGKRTRYQNSRGIHVSKNKFGDTVREEVIFNGEKVRYENP